MSRFCSIANKSEEIRRSQDKENREMHVRSNRTRVSYDQESSKQREKEHFVLTVEKYVNDKPKRQHISLISSVVDTTGVVPALTQLPISAPHAPLSGSPEGGARTASQPSLSPRRRPLPCAAPPRFESILPLILPPSPRPAGTPRPTNPRDPHDPARHRSPERRSAEVRTAIAELTAELRSGAGGREDALRLDER